MDEATQIAAIIRKFPLQLLLFVIAIWLFSMLMDDEQ